MVNALNNYLKSLLHYLEARFLKSKSKIFLSVLVSFIAGVAVFLWGRPDFNFNPTALTIVITSLLLIIVAIFWREDIWVRFIAIVLAFLFLGFVFASFYFHQFLQDPLGFDKKEIAFKGYICNDSDIRMQEIKYEICLLSLDEKKADFKILMTADLYPEYGYGEIISGKGNLERPGKIEDFDYQNFLLTKKIFAVIYKPKIKESQSQIQKSDISKYNYFIFQAKGLLFKIKNKFSETISQIMAEPEASFLKGLLLGERSTMSAELIDVFNKTGTTHIIALSGYNVTIIISVVVGVFVYLGRRSAFLISFLFVIFFVVMTGAASSVVRAAIMVLLVLAAPLLGRKAKSINILILTAAVMILFNPLILRYDLGFALSFLAISGLVLLSPILMQKFKKRRLAKMPKRIKDPLIETLSAQLFAFPLILYGFSKVSIIAPLTNVLIIPFIPLTMGLGFIAAVLGMVHRFIGEVSAYFPFFFLKYMIEAARLTSKMPLASIEINKFPAILTILIYLLIIMAVSFLNRKIIIEDAKFKIR